MADAVGNKIAKDYHIDVPYESTGFHVKGMNNCDWGMKNRLSQIFSPISGNTVMLAFDHGYIMGSTAGLERLDLVIPPLLEEVDVIMGTRGAIRSCIPAGIQMGIALRTSVDTTVANEDLSLGAGIGTDIEDAIRMNASCITAQTFVGAPGEKASLDALCKTVNTGNRYGIPTLGVIAVGKDMARDAKFFLLATRVVAELGAHIIKTYYCEDFEKVVAGCPVPIVIAGGKKLPENEALTMAYRAISEGARGVDMGRNIFQSESPKAMARAVKLIVHGGYTDKEAFEAYEELRHSL